MPRPKLKTIKPGLIYPTPDKPLRLRIGPGAEEGYVKLGAEWDAPDHIVDTKSFPWPIDDGVVDAIFSAFYFHRLCSAERHAFMEECWRVLKPGGQATIVCPYWLSLRATDPLSQWPPISEASWAIYSKQWREAERVFEPTLRCDFSSVVAHGMSQELMSRNDEFRSFVSAHYANMINDIHATLTAIK